MRDHAAAAANTLCDTQRSQERSHGATACMTQEAPQPPQLGWSHTVGHSMGTAGLSWTVNAERSDTEEVASRCQELQDLADNRA